MATILLAEDNANVRLSVRETLTRLGHEVIEVTNGLDAVRVYRDLVPDVVLMDIGMPTKDGLTATQEIRAFDPFARVAMLTAYGMESVIQQAREAGVSDFIVKPFVRTRLLAGIEKMLRGPLEPMSAS